MNSGSSLSSLGLLKLRLPSRLGGVSERDKSQLHISGDIELPPGHIEGASLSPRIESHCHRLPRLEWQLTQGTGAGCLEFGCGRMERQAKVQGVGVPSLC